MGGACSSSNSVCVAPGDASCVSWNVDPCVQSTTSKQFSRSHYTSHNSSIIDLSAVDTLNIKQTFKATSRANSKQPHLLYIV